MYGHEGVTRDLLARVRERTPAWLGDIRYRAGLSTGQLLPPVSVTPYFVPQYDLDDYPAISITELDTPTGLTGSRGVTADASYNVYVYNYPFRIFIYVQGHDYGDTELQLKRYLTAVRSALLEDVVLTANDQAHVTIQTESLTEAFYAPDESANQILGAGFVGVILRSEETIGYVHNEPDPNDAGPFEIRTQLGRIDEDTGRPVGLEWIGDPIRGGE